MSIYIISVLISPDVCLKDKGSVCLSIVGHKPRHRKYEPEATVLCGKQSERPVQVTSAIVINILIHVIYTLQCILY